MRQRKEEVEVYAACFPNGILSGLYGRKIPSCVNGMVNVNKFKITIESIEEEKEIIIERIEQLYLVETNPHNKDYMDGHCLRTFGFRMFDKIKKRSPQ